MQELISHLKGAAVTQLQPNTNVASDYFCQGRLKCRLLLEISQLLNVDYILHMLTWCSQIKMPRAQIHSLGQRLATSAQRSVRPILVKWFYPYGLV